MNVLHDPGMVDPSDWIEEVEGQLAIDVYHTPDAFIIKAPIAGVRQEDLEVSITDEMVSIKGERHNRQDDDIEEYLQQECYWGSFSRTYNLPNGAKSEGAKAKLVDGILTITIPKTASTRARTLSVQVD